MVFTLMGHVYHICLPFTPSPAHTPVAPWQLEHGAHTLFTLHTSGASRAGVVPDTEHLARPHLPMRWAPGEE